MNVSDDPTYLGLIEDVLDRPDDDTPRLVLADWLDEHGDADRADFIRYQLRFAGPHEGDGPDEALLRAGWGRRVERRLDNADYDPDWLLPGAMAGHYVEGDWSWSGWPHELCITAGGWVATIRRGFVAEVELPPAAFLAHAAGLFAWHPLERVTLTGLAPAGSPSPGAGRACWLHPSVPGGTGHRPPEPLFVLLRCYANRGAAPDRVRWYADADAARAALSAACLAFGRREARPLRKARQRPREFRA